MQERRTAEQLVAAVRVHADRVHDVVRRLGCDPDTAVEVVETSALELVATVAERPQAVPDEVGWWFARARVLSARTDSDDPDLPLGGGVLAADADQALLAGALEALPEDERFALLLRDSYDLSDTSVGAALGTDANSAMHLVARARLDFLPGVDDEPVPTLRGHAADLGALARIGEGRPVQARDATTRRHAQSCATCRAVVEAQDYAHRLLAGLTVAALPDADRDALLRRVEVAARAALPAAATLAATVAAFVEEEDDDEPRRLLTPLWAALGLLLAIGAGIGLGLLLEQGPPGIDAQTAANGVPLVRAAPVPSMLVAPRPASQAPLPLSVVTLAPRLPPSPSPSPSPSPVASPSASALPTEELTLSVDPSSGPNGANIVVSGTGWVPDEQVTVVYLDATGQPTDSSAVAVPDDTGQFSVTLAAQDPSNVPGPHEVRASNDEQTASNTYDAQP